MWENFMLSLEIMGKGMASIFAVIIILTLIVMLLAKISSRKKNGEE
jgi:Na+-transporting methylmalonyl-CoA/oxaloacetate decarboxylase gamma subunit